VDYVPTPGGTTVGEDYYSPSNHTRIEPAFGQAVQAANLRIHELTHRHPEYRSMAAVVAPLVNSYKRLGVAPKRRRVSLGAHPPWRAAAGARPSIGRGTRLELRVPDPSCNPYWHWRRC